MKADILTLETAKKIANLERDVQYYKETRDELITNNVKLREEKIKYKNVINKIKTYVNIYKEINGYYDKKIYDEDLKENILEYIGEVDE